MKRGNLVQIGVMQTAFFLLKRCVISMSNRVTTIVRAPFNSFLIVGAESSGIKEQRMAEYFNFELGPLTARSQKSFASRWSDMKDTYKSVLI